MGVVKAVPACGPRGVRSAPRVSTLVSCVLPTLRGREGPARSFPKGDSLLKRVFSPNGLRFSCSLYQTPKSINWVYFWTVLSQQLGLCPCSSTTGPAARLCVASVSSGPLLLGALPGILAYVFFRVNLRLLLSRSTGWEDRVRLSYDVLLVVLSVKSGAAPVTYQMPENAA